MSQICDLLCLLLHLLRFARMLVKFSAKCLVLYDALMLFVLYDAAHFNVPSLVLMLLFLKLVFHVLFIIMFAKFRVTLDSL